jgi:hypothetical protein
MKNTTKLILIGIVDCFIAVIGFASMWLTKLATDINWFNKTSLMSTYSGTKELPYPGITLALSCMIIALVTFFGLLAASESSGKGWGLNKGSMRGAIAATIVVVYLFVLSMNAFVPYNKTMPPMMTTMVTSFTAIIAIMIPFYFGASAYVQAQTKDADTKKVTEALKDQ